MSLFAAAAETASTVGVDLNGIIGGGGTAALIGIVYWVGKLILDRAVPTRSDARASQTLVLESLSSMVKVLQEEKIQDGERLKAKQARIDELQDSADADYDRMRDLRAEIVELRDRLAQKDRNIRILVLELRRLGAVVSGIDEDTEAEDIEVTLNPEDVRLAREQYESRNQIEGSNS